MESNASDTTPDILERLRSLLHKTELLLQCPSLPKEMKQTLGQHELVEQARAIVSQEERK